MTFGCIEVKKTADLEPNVEIVMNKSLQRFFVWNQGNALFFLKITNDASSVILKL